MENEQQNVPEIGREYINLKRLLEAKGVKTGRLTRALLSRLLHIKDLNAGIYEHRDKFGLDFVDAFFYGDLGITVDTIHPERITQEGYPIIAGNHPLGGPDGLALMGAVGKYRKDILFPVNDFLMHLPGLKSLFVPIDKVNKNKNIEALENAFAGENTLLYFPAGMCSRLQKGKIRDLEWKPTFVKKAVRYQRDIIPVYFEARNRRRFYWLANLRKRLGVKFNFEMALLPGEMYAQKGKTFKLVVGKPIAWSRFDNSHTAKEWAAMLHDYVYRLKDNPDEEF
ncbi:MAG: glycerol acyltransferase [Bacteroidales bacterium]|nr:glycerol acyltransferase [Bacteroidales bacterium]